MNKISSDTIARTICLGLALFNQLLAIYGKQALEFTNDEVYQFVSLVATFGTAIVAWWKNNSFTKAAIEADEIMWEKKYEEGQKAD